MADEFLNPKPRSGRYFEFTPVITLGHVLQVIAIMGGALLAFSEFRSKLDIHDVRLSQMESSTEKTTQISTRLTERMMRVETQQEAILRMLDKLEPGKSH